MVNALDILPVEAGAFHVMDPGYVDFARLYAMHQAGAFFVTRAKRGMDARRVYSSPTQRDTVRSFDVWLAPGTNLEAFAGCGNNDDLFSGDLSDFLSIVDGCDSLIAECRQSDPALLAYLSDRAALLRV